MSLPFCIPLFGKEDSYNLTFIHSYERKRPKKKIKKYRFIKTLKKHFFLKFGTMYIRP